MSVQRIGDLDVDQNLAYQRREWIFQRIGWAVMSVIAVAAFLGLFGRGLLSDQSRVSDDGALQVDYRRFERADSPLSFTVTAANSSQNGQIDLWLDRDYVDAMQIQRVVPEPDSVTATSDRLIYTFTVDDEAPALTLTFHLRPDTIGSHEARIGVTGGPALSFTQFVYP